MAFPGLSGRCCSERLQGDNPLQHGLCLVDSGTKNLDSSEDASWMSMKPTTKKSLNNSWWNCWRCEILWLKKTSSIGLGLRIFQEFAIPSQKVWLVICNGHVLRSLSHPSTELRSVAPCAGNKKKGHDRCSWVAGRSADCYTKHSLKVTCWVETWVRDCYTLLKSNMGPEKLKQAESLIATTFFLGSIPPIRCKLYPFQGGYVRINYTTWVFPKIGVP